MSDNNITKTLLMAAAVAAASGLGTYLLTRTTQTIEAGSQAINAEQIKLVIQQELKTADGKTYGQLLTEIRGKQGQILTEVENLKDEVDDIEDALLILAGD